MRAAAMSWPEYRDAVASRLVVLPVGALDAHGPHLPLATDTILAEYLADALADRVPLVRLPALPFGRRTEPARGGGRFPGAVDLSPATLSAVATDVLRALHRDGARRVLILDNHMANLDTLRAAATAFVEAAPGARVMVTSWWDHVSEATRNRISAETGVPRELDHHAALVETSLVMCARPELVRAEKLVDEPPVRVVRHFVVPLPDECATAHGVVYRARGATAEIGRVVLTEVLDGLAAAVRTDLL